MPASVHTFIHLVFIGFIALLPVVNPVGTAFMVSPYFTGLTRAERRSIVQKIALYAFCLCTVTLFTGHWILELFGISVPVIQLAGGIMICKMGWEFLSSDKPPAPETGEENDTAALTSKMTDLDSKIFYPITFPMTTGAGTISVIFTLSAHASNNNLTQYFLNSGALLLSIIIMCLLVFIFYINANRLVSYMGSRNEMIINRIMAFLIFCVGLQIAVGGITTLIKG